MRKINITETLKAVNFVTSNGMVEEVNLMANLVKSGKPLNIREVGVQFILGCISKLTTDKALAQFFAILSGPFEVDAQELKEMELEQFLDLLVQFLDTIDAENLKGFFKSVAISMEKFR